jgi:hypothetical protein
VATVLDGQLIVEFRCLDLIAHALAAGWVVVDKPDIFALFLVDANSYYPEAVCSLALRIVMPRKAKVL